MPFTDVIPGSPSATNYIFQIEITNYQKDSSTNANGNGYWIYHNENDNAGTQQGPFDGQAIAGLGNGSYISNQDGYRISNPSSSNAGFGVSPKTTLQISIGFPSNLSASIEDVTINFLKY